MYFGAGNLILPPALAVSSLPDTWPALAGFLLSAVGLPVIGVAAVARAGSLQQLASRVHPKFAAVLLVVVYLTIGPALAIPRTASTSFEMLAQSVLHAAGSTRWLLVGYSAVFFAAAMMAAARPEKLTKILGRVTSPLLLLMILIITLGAVFAGHSASSSAASQPVAALADGFITGYQTMDAIAALVYGIVVIALLRTNGVSQPGKIMSLTIISGLVAGVVMAIIYTALAFVGVQAGPGVGDLENGAQILSLAAGNFFGPMGGYLLALVFLLACFNTSVGLLASGSQFFATTFPQLKQRTWLLLLGGASFLVANLGLTKILQLSVPILVALYPVLIVLIVVALLPQRWLATKLSVALPVVLALLVGLTDAAGQHEAVAAWFAWLNWLPGKSSGLGFVCPALLGLGVGMWLSWRQRR